ncbi:hypothetical protein [Paenibacillus ferrarius]|uniref:hypothetical protein n=1 Tax=Paenibacillus ferrarius TaxID=1469647 RepID=UPI00117C36E4|nr:hypothetical protein [Paenibacillus ferrarius]
MVAKTCDYASFIGQIILKLANSCECAGFWSSFLILGWKVRQSLHNCRLFGFLNDFVEKACTIAGFPERACNPKRIAAVKPRAMNGHLPLLVHGRT